MHRLLRINHPSNENSYLRSSGIEWNLPLFRQVTSYNLRFEVGPADAGRELTGNTILPSHMPTKWVFNLSPRKATGSEEAATVGQALVSFRNRQG